VPVDVNRGGHHTLYLYGYSWSTIDKRGTGEATGKFALLADGRPIDLIPSSAKPHDLGFGETPLAPPARSATPLIVATNREVLLFLAQSRDVRALRSRGGLDERFDLWEDGRSAIGELLPGGGARH